MSGGVTARQIRAFQKRVWRFYREGGKRDFPWRTSRDPYEILVSEIMLQQTQTTRVLQYFERFIREYPSFEALARGSRIELLRHWQGLGYNRRALFLQRACAEIDEKYGGVMPATESLLRSLPGIGVYTAAALRVFVFNQPAVVIETNIRSAFIEEFFEGKGKVADSDLRPLIERACDLHQPREWYYALMDYGAFVKKQSRGITARSAHHARQSQFEGSVRQVRGAIIRALIKKHRLSIRTVRRVVDDDVGSVENERFERALEGLCREELVRVQGGRLMLVG